ncbi:MAG: outer membrane protein assembly factor BamE [Nitrospinae bacterium]|nr:outer membrane protein assembly factor BamE [Nitrospinota bacterium]
MKKVIIIFLFLLTFYGCATVGKDFDITFVKRIEKGKTTKQEINDNLGPPFRKGTDNGELTWTYVYNKWSAGGTTYSKDLYIIFDKNGAVRSYVFNTNIPGEDVEKLIEER